MLGQESAHNIHSYRFEVHVFKVHCGKDALHSDAQGTGSLFSSLGMGKLGLGLGMDLNIPRG